MLPGIPLKFHININELNKIILLAWNMH